MQHKHMKPIVIIDFLKEAANQIFGVQNRRTGKVMLTHRAFIKMQEHQLDTDTLEDTFRNGQETDEGKIVQDYYNFSVGMYYAWDEVKGKYIITTCWKQRYKSH